jgi:hypothetical protein
MKFADAKEWKEIQTRMIQDGIDRGTSDRTTIPNFMGGDTDWQDQYFKTGIQQKYDLSISGGSRDARFRVKGARRKDPGPRPFCRKGDLHMPGLDCIAQPDRKHQVVLAGRRDTDLSGSETGSADAEIFSRDLVQAGVSDVFPIPEEAASSNTGAGVDDWKKRKEEQARRRKIANDLKKCEAEIARLEEEGERLDEEVSLPENSTDPDRLRELTAKREAVDQKLGDLYEQWELLSEQAEEDS